MLYAAWLVYASGLKHVLLSSLLYAPGVVLFAKARREAGQPAFTKIEKLIFAAVLASAGVGTYGLFSGMLAL